MKQHLIFLMFLIFVSGLFAQSPSPQTQLKPEQANSLAATALECIKNVEPQKGLAPGESFVCNRWLSAMHSHWALIELLKNFPGLPLENEIRKETGENLNPLTVELITTELTQNTRIFEDSESWSWALQLQTTLDAWDDPDAAGWAAALKPFTDLLVNQFLQHTMTMSGLQPEKATPHRAFALSLAWDYAETTDNMLLKEMIQNKSLDLYLSAEQCEFTVAEGYFAPCLTEAALMARTAPGDLLKPWLERYLPAFSKDPAVATQSFLLTPPNASAQEITQSLSAAWSMNYIGKKPGNNQAFEAESRQLIDQSLEMIMAGNMNDPVVVTFVVYAISRK